MGKMHERLLAFVAPVMVMPRTVSVDDNCSGILGGSLFQAPRASEEREESSFTAGLALSFTLLPILPTVLCVSHFSYTLSADGLVVQQRSAQLGNPPMNGRSFASVRIATAGMIVMVLHNVMRK